MFYVVLHSKPNNFSWFLARTFYRLSYCYGPDCRSRTISLSLGIIMLQICRYGLSGLAKQRQSQNVRPVLLGT